MLPTFLVIGAMKAGTTALAEYLRPHPQVFMAVPKELDFFTDPGWEQGLAWYEHHFDGATAAAARGEASPNYSKRHLQPEVAARIAATLPEVRLVYLIRHPIERIRSMYIHLVADGHEPRPLRTALVDDPDYVLTSSYAYQLEPYLERFDRSRILVLDADRLRHDRMAALAEVLRFIGVEPRIDPESVAGEHNRSVDRRPVDAAIPADVEQELRRRLAPDVAKLRGLVPDCSGWDFA